MSKLTRVQVLIIGCLVSIIVGVGMFFLLVRPRMQKFAEVDAKLKERQQVAAQLERLRQTLRRRSWRISRRGWTTDTMKRQDASHLLQRPDAGDDCSLAGEGRSPRPMIEKWPRKSVWSFARISDTARADEPERRE